MVWLQRALQNTSFDNPEELQEEINILTVGIQRNRAKVLGIEPPPEEDVSMMYSRTSLARTRMAQTPGISWTQFKVPKYSPI